MIYSLESSRYLHDIPHKHDYQTWRGRLSAAEYNAIMQDLRSRIFVTFKLDSRCGLDGYGLRADLRQRLSVRLRRRGEVLRPLGLGSRPHPSGRLGLRPLCEGRVSHRGADLFQTRKPAPALSRRGVGQPR